MPEYVEEALCEARGLTDDKAVVDIEAPLKALAERINDTEMELIRLAKQKETFLAPPPPQIIEVAQELMWRCAAENCTGKRRVWKGRHPSSGEPPVENSSQGQPLPSRRQWK